MKKIIAMGCFFLFTISLSQEEIEMDQYELQLQQDESEDEFELPPISINISVANINEIHSNNKTNVCQEQTKAKESEKKNVEDRQRLFRYAKNAAALAILIGSPSQEVAAISNVWKIIW